jgi:hypothetical protein
MKPRGNYDWYETASNGKPTYVLLTEKQAKNLPGTKPATFQTGRKVRQLFGRGGK